MELIIKPTERCNFKCTFCSSTSIADDVSDELGLEHIYTFLRRFPDTHTIIVNGGDPLMMKPSYYTKLLAHLDEHDYPTTVAFTTNLWPFYMKPEKWLDIFLHPRIGITTSFHYGDSRLKGDYSVFSEEDFWAVSDKMLELVGYRPGFISVIDEVNADKALDNVRLAKKMGVECKLNYTMASGIAGRPYQLSKMYSIYLDVYEAGLTEWEFNTKQMVERLRNESMMCPQNRACDSTIRALQPSGDYYSCGAMGDDREYAIDFEREMAGEFFTPLQHDPDIQTMRSDGECYSCPMFQICNGCKKTVKDTRRHNMVETHCTLMKQLAPRIIDANNG
jgi:radical SAM protein with 4Fe4S-binding SPASM domain